MRKQELHPRTAILNKSQKNQSKKARSHALQWLAENFPAAFDNSVRISPLKKGIMSDILEHADQATASGISKSKLREAVVLYTRRLDYLTCLKSREMRIDLAGNPTEQVTESDAQCAAVKIKKRIEKSARNVKMMTGEKSAETHNTSVQTKASPSIAADDYLPTYPLRSPSHPTSVTPTKTPPSIVIKHKTTRQFDPQAVARLKEKLGISRRVTEAKEETLD